MFLTDGFGDPNNRGSAILSCKVGHDLAEMGVIGRAELVFYDDHSAFDIAREKIYREIANCDFCTLKLKITKLERVRQERQVFGFGKPRGEVLGLMCPDLAERDR